MAQFRRILPMLGNGAPIILAAPGYLNPALSFVRAQASGAVSTALAPDGATWVEYAANVPRFHGLFRRLSIEGQRTNSARNPRAEGAVAGTPGTAPTHWTSDTTNRTVHGTVVINGLPLLDLTYAPSAAGNRQLQLDSNFIAAAPGETWTSSYYVNLQSGLVTARVEIEYRDSGGAIVAGGTSGSIFLSTQNVLTRLATTRTAPAGTARITTQVRFTFSAATTARVQYGAPQIEVGAFASTPILPAIGTPAAATRGEDSISATLTSLGIPASGDCTLLWSGVVQAAAPVNANQTMLHVDSGTNTNRYFLRVAAGASGVQVGRSNVGVTVSSPTIAAMVAGAPFRAGMTISNGRAAGSVNGSALQEVTGGVTSGLTVFRVGTDASNAAALFGETLTVRLLRGAVSDQQLRALVAALPV